MNNDLGNASDSAMIKGLFGSCLAVNISGPMRGDRSDEEIGAMFENLFAGETYRRGLQPDATPKQVENMDNRFQGGFLQLKQMTYEHLKRLEQKYGSYASQMHPDDFISKLGPEFFDEMRMLQDAEQMMVSGSQFFDMDNNQEDREFKKLSDYYNNVFLTLQGYATNNKNLISPELGYSPDPNGMEGFALMDFVWDTYADGQGVGGPAMSKKMEKKYLRDLRKQYREKELRNHLFGKFK